MIGPPPPGVLDLYSDHDGSPSLPRRGDTWLPIRLLPAVEAIRVQQNLRFVTEEVSSVGRVAWLWTDDNSNYVGIYTDGVLSGWLVKLNHEEPCLAPAYRSVENFVSRALATAPGQALGESAALDVGSIPTDVPAVVDDPVHVETDRQLALFFFERYASEADDDLRRVYAMSSMCLTPVADTHSLIRFLGDDDMWTPEAAIRLLELRRFDGAVSELEQLALNGHGNGDSAAMRLLVRQSTNASRAALKRLKTTLTGPKLEMLEMWMRGRLQPPWWN